MGAKRIFISGASGTGKTTLAKWISKEYNIPFIETSTKPLWPEFGVKSHKELIEKGEKDIKFMLDFQHAVIRFRDKQLSGVTEFVTDRGAMDIAVYYLMQACHKVNQPKAEYYFARCAKLQQMASHQIIIPFNYQTVLENDGMRIQNIFYQRMTSDLFETDTVYDLVRMGYKQENEHIARLYLPIWDMEERQSRVKEFLK